MGDSRLPRRFRGLCKYSAKVTKINAKRPILRLTKAGWLVKLGAGKYAIVPPSAGEEAVPEANPW
jgi:predicted transcriptional regulator of viral defense system